MDYNMFRRLWAKLYVKIIVILFLIIMFPVGFCVALIYLGMRIERRRGYLSQVDYGLTGNQKKRVGILEVD
ncbi:MAG: hypothetical protein GF311_26655 [Candidatus Lokiarchaeota archaeon]|nr:hypothetical protein [Candidatus Lokiarchaeota archaeon]